MKKEIIYQIVLKHLPGQHDQKMHGWRYGGISQARSSMRRQTEEGRAEYRKRAGMPKPEKKFTERDKIIKDFRPMINDLRTSVRDMRTAYRKIEFKQPLTKAEYHQAKVDEYNANYKRERTWDKLRYELGKKIDKKSTLFNDVMKRVGEISGDPFAENYYSTKERIILSVKHLPGQHNQKRHGWRYGGLTQARRSMRGQDEGERTEYRKRAGMPKPEKRTKVEGKPDASKSIAGELLKQDISGYSKKKFFPEKFTSALRKLGDRMVEIKNSFSETLGTRYFFENKDGNLHISAQVVRKSIGASITPKKELAHIDTNGRLVTNGVDMEGVFAKGLKTILGDIAK